MNTPPRIALIHATRVAIDPIETAAQAYWPAAETMSILEEGLSMDRAKTAELTVDLSRRIVDLSRYAIAAGSDGVLFTCSPVHLFTCSAFGSAIKRADAEASVTVMKPNEAMFDAAFSHGQRIAMVYTFPPAAAGLEQEFSEAAKARESNAKIVSVFCDGALAAKRAGNEATHDRLIADCVADIESADVILLAKISMASAADAARRRTTVPVLTSPQAAITEMRRCIERGGKDDPC